MFLLFALRGKASSCLNDPTQRHLKFAKEKSKQKKERLESVTYQSRAFFQKITTLQKPSMYM
jgi:hypothetical protein